MTLHSTIQLLNGEAVRLTPNGLHSGMDITIQNLDDADYVYIGGAGVNSEDFGYRLSPGAAWSVELPGTDAIYAVTNTNAYIAVLKTNLESGN